MQERRTTIRLPHHCRVHYCSSEDLLPKDGYLMNLSEQGAGLVLRESHQEQEQVTISFSLPGEVEPITATGTVRWSQTQAGKPRWHPTGLSWLPLEESARLRLHRWLYTATQHPAGRGPNRTSLRRAVRVAMIAIGIELGLLAILWWAIGLRRENQDLQAEIQRRAMMIVHLEQHGEQLREALGAANTSLAATTEAVDRLEDQALMVEGQVAQVRDELQHIQALYDQARRDRSALVQRMTELDRERQLLAQQITSHPSPQLQRAMERAIATIVAERRARASPHGNQGYLLRAGHQTRPGAAGPWIWVHEPEPSP